MSNQSESGDDKRVEAQLHHTFVDAEGTDYTLGSHRGGEGLGESELREALAEAYDVNPEEIGLPGPDRRSFSFPNGKNKSTAGFSGRWNSSWDPHAESPKGDPNLN